MFFTKTNKIAPVSNKKIIVYKILNIRTQKYLTDIPGGSKATKYFSSYNEASEHLICILELVSKYIKEDIGKEGFEILPEEIEEELKLKGRGTFSGGPR